MQLKSSKRASSRKSVRASRYGGSVNAETGILVELAALLLGFGINPHRLTTIMTRAFAHAAARSARLKNGRVSYARVAAKTGLRRAVVTTLLDKGPPPLIALSPVDRVANGWRTDSDFLDKAGKPIELKLAGKQKAFARLARRYARDIPQRALIQELLAEGLVSCTNDGLRLRRARRKLVSLASDSFLESIRQLLDEAQEKKTGTRPKESKKNHRY